MIVGIIVCIIGIIELELSRRERREQNELSIQERKEQNDRIQEQNALLKKLIDIFEKK